MIRTLPLADRNRLAGIILAALHDAGKRRELAALAVDGPAATAWFGADRHGDVALLRARAASASRALAGRASGRKADALGTLLGDAAALWDARCFFEVHELLEPAWRVAEGETREVLQALVQAAVGYQHLANGNLAGARALLAEGGVRLHGRRFRGLDLDAFARELAGTLGRLEEFDWASLPPFPDLGGGE